jgi:hypothetical protein
MWYVFVKLLPLAISDKNLVSVKCSVWNFHIYNPQL